MRTFPQRPDPTHAASGFLGLSSPECPILWLLRHGVPLSNAYLPLRRSSPPKKQLVQHAPSRHLSEAPTSGLVSELSGDFSPQTPPQPPLPDHFRPS